LKIFDFTVDPINISSVFEIEPTKMWRIGEFIPKTTIKHKSNGWVYYTEYSEEKTISDHIESILGVFYPKLDDFKNLENKSKIQISIILYMYGGDRPIFHISSEITRKISELNAELDVDLFSLPE
jgi:hypothetical protein